MKSIAAAAHSVAALLLVISFASAASAQEAQPPPWPSHSSDMDRAPLDAVLNAAKQQPGTEPPAPAAIASPSIRDTIREVIQDTQTPAAAPVVVRTVPVQPGAGVLPASPPKAGATLRPWEVFSRPPAWTWPPLAWPSAAWATAPGAASASRTWQGGWQPAPPWAVRIASATVLPAGARLPAWVQDMSQITVEASSTPSWRRLPAPDLRVPAGRSHVADPHEPPSRFLRWSDRIETVLPADRASVQKVTRLCEALGSKPPPAGKLIRGCAHHVVGRCLITRVADPSVARHELAHCNGWPPDHPS